MDVNDNEDDLFPFIRLRAATRNTIEFLLGRKIETHDHVDQKDDEERGAGDRSEKQVAAKLKGIE